MSGAPLIKNTQGRVPSDVPLGKNPQGRVASGVPLASNPQGQVASGAPLIKNPQGRAVLGPLLNLVMVGARVKSLERDRCTINQELAPEWGELLVLEKHRGKVHSERCWKRTVMPSSDAGSETLLLFGCLAFVGFLCGGHTCLQGGKLALGLFLFQTQLFFAGCVIDADLAVVAQKQVQKNGRR